ncbi:MAG TPA: hypothetical protein VGH27_28380 [Streptosporangiaceae bacterium]
MPEPVSVPPAAVSPRWTAASAGAVAAGLVLVVAPALAAPGWIWLVALGGAIAAVASVQRRWTGLGTLAAAAAIIECAAAHLSTIGLAGEGLLLLAFLLLAGTPAALAPEAAGRWLRLQVPAALAGVAGTVVVLAALAAKPVASIWLVAVGLVAAVAAYYIALPRRPR